MLLIDLSTELKGALFADPLSFLSDDDPNEMLPQIRGDLPSNDRADVYMWCECWAKPANAYGHIILLSLKITE